MTKLLYPVVFFNENDLFLAYHPDFDMDDDIKSADFNTVVKLAEKSLKKKSDDFIEKRRIAQFPTDKVHLSDTYPNQRIEYLTVEVSNEIYNSSVLYYKEFSQNLEKFLCNGPSKLKYITSNNSFANIDYDNDFIIEDDNDRNKILDDDFIIENDNNGNKILDDEFLIEEC